jgi:hypothetical protein
VRHFPPALTILALAVSVNLRAATVSLGTSRSLMSSVTVPTITAILSLQRKVRSPPRVLPLVTKMLHEAGDRDGWSVDLGGNESSHDGLCEG